MHMAVGACLLLLSLASANPLHEAGGDRSLVAARYSEDPEVYLDTEGLIRRWGFPVEKHEVTTRDGYILTMFRIPSGRNVTVHTSSGQRPVVLFQHGFLGSSDMWVDNLPEQDAAFLFADAGVDVWLGNFRGNRYGRRHAKLNADIDYKAFFDFSWPEMAKYDLPAMVDEILNTTNASSIYYVGHSMGSLTMFAELARDKEFAKKVKRVYALAPILKVENVKGLGAVIANYLYPIDNTLRRYGIEEFLPTSWLTRVFGQYVCGSSEPVGSTVCSSTLFMMAGPSSSQLNRTRLAVYLSHTPAGTSRRTFIHLGQMVRNGQIGEYDYGVDENRMRYGSDTPPQYDLGLIETPIALYWGDKDWLSTDKDIRKALPQLKSVFSKNYLGEFNHMDFVWGTRAPTEIYHPILEDIRKDFVPKKRRTLSIF